MQAVVDNAHAVGMLAAKKLVFAWYPVDYILVRIDLVEYGWTLLILNSSGSSK